MHGRDESSALPIYGGSRCGVKEVHGFLISRDFRRDCLRRKTRRAPTLMCDHALPRPVVQRKHARDCPSLTRELWSSRGIWVTNPPPLFILPTHLTRSPHSSMLQECRWIGHVKRRSTSFSSCVATRSRLVVYLSVHIYGTWDGRHIETGGKWSIWKRKAEGLSKSKTNLS